MLNIPQHIASELNVKPQQIEATIQLVQEGATIPFIARYRKEVTGSLDDDQLRLFEERYSYLTALEARKETILKSIESQEKLTPELEAKIQACLVKSDLEDLYLPFKPKRLTKAVQAREAGFEPLALELWNSPESTDPLSLCEPHADESKGYKTAADVLEGCMHIMIEKFSEDADLLAKLKAYLKSSAIIQSKVLEGKEEEGIKFKDYYDYREPLSSIKSHRFLALQRGGLTSGDARYLSVSINSNPQELPVNPCEDIIQRHVLEGTTINLEPNTDLNKWRNTVLSRTWKGKLANSLETELFAMVRAAAEEEAINVFASNLRALMLASPAKSQAVLGLDPGLRTGVKVAVVDNTSKVLDTTVVPNFSADFEKSAATLDKLIKKHGITLIVIGNGTGSRETERMVSLCLEKYGHKGKVSKIIVSEAGASVYSASELAAIELPDLDVSFRGAVSIARRLQDPMAELVKIDPKSIGVGQYQHDVNQTALSRKLDTVVEDCVNKVGVDVNTASASILEYISGLRKNVAAKIVSYRNENGRFSDRKELLKVPGLGAKAFEQCAGFLRVIDGKNPLDNSSVHPESYSVVTAMAEKLGVAVADLVGNESLLKQLNASDFVNDKVGLPTILDIIEELQKPGRDPRGEFEVISFKEGVESISDLEVGMVLNGLVTNVTNFGCFVDVGVHQDGLVHIKNMSSKYIEDPSDLVKPGEEVKVEVLAVDIERNRIELTMILEEERKALKAKTKEERAKQKAKRERAKEQKNKAAKGEEGRANNVKRSLGKANDAQDKAGKNSHPKGKQNNNAHKGNKGGKGNAGNKVNARPVPTNTAFAQAFLKAKKK